MGLQILVISEIGNLHLILKILKIASFLNVQPYELFMLEPLKNKIELENELFEALKKDENLLRLVYKFYQTIK